MGLIITPILLYIVGNPSYPFFFSGWLEFPGSHVHRRSRNTFHIRVRSQRNADFSHPVGKNMSLSKLGSFCIGSQWFGLVDEQQKFPKLTEVCSYTWSVNILFISILYKATRPFEGSTSESAHSEMPGDSWPRRQRGKVMEAPNVSD